MSVPNEIDYSQFGGKPIEEEEKINETETIEEQPRETDYSQFGGSKVEVKPEKEKVGSFKSALYGIAEGFLGIKGIIDQVKNYTGKKALNLVGIKPGAEPRNPAFEIMSEFPESEGQVARRWRVAGQGLPISTAFGMPGIISALISGQAGQTVREVWGKDGKFEKFGWGEGAAIGTDILFGFGSNVLINTVKSGTRQTISKTPQIFRTPTSKVGQRAVEQAVNQEKHVLNNIVKGFSKTQLKNFEESISGISPTKYTQITESNLANIKSQTDKMFRDTYLGVISPFEVTKQQGGIAIQDAANATFRTEVLAAERALYEKANTVAENLSGQAPKALEEAKKIRSTMTVNNPTPEQRSTITFLDGLIDSLETETAEVATRKANDLVDLVQKSNNAVNYGGELRYQSHRLKPVVNTLRQEVNEILSKDPLAYQAYQQANLLHARNAQVWGTKFMRDVRFNQNPENLIKKTTKASNMQNFKQAVQDPTIQGLTERLAVESITEGGSSRSNQLALKNLSPQLSETANQSGQDLINIKNPLTTVGGRNGVINSILKDAASSVNTGKKPTQILKLMETDKGYKIVKEALIDSKDLFKTFERQFMEDVINSISTDTGMIDFKKLGSVFKNNEIKQVVEQIGGESLVNKFNKLEGFAKNFEKNMALYSQPKTQSLIQNIAKDVKGTSILAFIMHQLHMPWPLIVAAGLAKTGAKATKVTFKALDKKLLSNPRAFHYLEQLSKASSSKDIAKQLPRLINELNKGKED